MVGQHTRKPQVCKFFQKTGRCQFGSKCRFSHDLSANGAATNVKSTTEGRHMPKSPFYPRLRTWKFNIPRNTQPVTPLGSAELQKFLDTALNLVASGEPETVQQVVESLASDGGLARIEEAIRTIAAPSSDRRCLQNGENMLLPLLNVLTHPDVTQSFILEKSLGAIHNFMYGIGGRRAVSCFSAAARFLSLFEAPSAEKSKAVVAVLACLHNIVELNSSAKVVEEIHAVVRNLTELLEGDLTQNPDARRLLQRMKDRLNEGKAIPNVDSPHLTFAIIPHMAALKLERDQPGRLSPKGARHDNDHDDINLISILPTAPEVQSERAEYLPIKDPRTLHLGGVEGLVDRHFRLLREDTIGQLRDIVRSEIETLRDPSSPALVSSKAQQNVRRFAYKDVRLMQVTFDRVAGLRAHLSLPQPKAVVKKSELVRRQWWEHSKRLCPDALLCLVDATENVTFFTVCGNEAGRGLSDGNCSKLLYQDPQTASVIVRLVEPFELDIERLVTSLSSQIPGPHVLCEFPGVLLPSFYPTLKALQKMSVALDLPFGEIIAPSDTHVIKMGDQPPSYAMKPGFKFDLKSIVGNEHLELSMTGTFDYAALAEKSSLDEAQQTAVIDALSRKLALIQGPPGTGKSFTGVAIIKVLLDNAFKASLGPIVCVCYTNHALDQLLEHLVKDGVEGIIRVGSRSKSEIVKRFNLRDAVQSEERTSTERRRFAVNRSAIESEAEEMKPLLEVLTKPKHPKVVRKFLQRTCRGQYRQLYRSKEDDDGFEIVDNDRRDPLFKWLHPKGTHEGRLETGSSVTNRSLDRLQRADVWSMTLQERRMLHDHWAGTLKNEALTELSSMLSTISEHVEELGQCRKEDDLRALTKAKVIGVTTSGLARNLDVLRRLQSKVLVCEEAGEVLEAHLLTALLPSVEHAVLIGDHQQLKPQIANYELSSENSRGVQYSLDISLFERLLHPNVPEADPVPFSTLKTQRRMHPSIAQLIRSTLYPGLVDHQSVHDYPAVEGMRRRLFWLDHDHPESSAERRDSTSHTNDFEAEMVAALVHHLVRQSKYSSEDIAVLTPYLGQLVKLRNKLESSFEIVVGDRDQAELEKEGLNPDASSTIQTSVAKKTSLSKAVRLATVDNFQGEEAKIVIVSLVRSNQERRCGFLKTTNRINVLLSRAQHGMYLFGDSNTYKHIRMWQQVIQMLEDNGSLGDSLALHCPRHPNNAIEVATADDFATKAPEGGCDLMYVTSANREKMAKYFEVIILPAKGPVGGLTPRAVIIVGRLAMPDPLVDSVHLPAKYAAPIPGVPNPAMSRVRHARKIVHGRALTLENAIYLALFLAINCLARSAARQRLNVDISVPRSICCSEETKGIMVDYLLGATYGETNLDEDPCLVPDCGHLMAMSSMDGNFSLADYYEMHSNGEIVALKGSSLPFSAEGIKTCPVCRGPLRNINRYSRIVRRSAIDEATKKFISWSNLEITEYADKLHKIQQQFAALQDIAQFHDHRYAGRWADLELGRQSDTTTLEGHRNQVMADISRIKGLKSRYREPYRVRSKLSEFARKVREDEQPFGRLWELLQHRRRRHRLSSDLVYDPSVLQVNVFLMSMSLSIKFDITIIADALAIRKRMTGLASRYDWGAVDLEVDFSQLRGECLTLIGLVAAHQQHRLEIEAKLSFAHLAALERSAIVGSLHISRSNDLRELGLEQLQDARHIHEQYPGQTTGVTDELEAVESMLNDGTFYNVVTSEEQRAVYAAMSHEFSGTGHWYTCENGHPFTVGECGMPMEQARCPQCGSPIGGQHHQPAQGVRDLDEVQAAMGNMDLGR